MEILNQVLQPILLISLPVLVVAVMSWLIKSWQEKSASLNQKQLNTMRWIVSLGIWAAEQAWMAGNIKKEEREGFVLNFAQSLAYKYKLNVNVQEVIVFIKAAVAEEFNKGKIVIPGLPGPVGPGK